MTREKAKGPIFLSSQAFRQRTTQTNHRTMMHSSLKRSLLVLLWGYSWVLPYVSSEQHCLANKELNDIFVVDGAAIPKEGSCCQQDVCNIPCAEPVSSPDTGFGIAVGIGIFVTFLIGLLAYFVVQGEAANYFVAGKSLPLWIVTITLGAQSYHFFDGAVIPIGLGLSLILNGIFFAAKINSETNCLTLPDVFAKRYGRIVEVLVSITTITSFLMLLAGNLVGMGVITSYLWGISEGVGIWITAIIVWAYAVSGGLFSVAYTDVIQGVVGWTGCLLCAYYLIANEKSNPSPSIGFENYIYPNDEICDLYDGGPCGEDTSLCCYNATKWCDSKAENCQVDNGAYPIGDQRVFADQMSNPQALTPFPNAIFWNWATIFILAFGNLGALDFQVRCMAAKTPKIARFGCILGGCFTFFVGIPFSYLGGITRVFYGPDSVHAVFEADTCSTILGLPTCGAWLPDSVAFVKLLTHQAPPILGAWCLIGIVAASMSTADGAILAMGTVFSHNIMTQLETKFPKIVMRDNLLMMARLSTIPFTVASATIGAFYRSSESAAGATGYLLIVAFDIVLASVVAPLFGCYYTKNPSSRAAICSILAGIIARVTLEFVLPKDGFLLLPYDLDEFYNYGPAASASLPTFVYNPDAREIWDPVAEECEQDQFEDFTGVDSLFAFVCSILVFVAIQFLEEGLGRALFNLPGMVGYEKDLEEKEKTEADPEQPIQNKRARGIGEPSKSVATIETGLSGSIGNLMADIDDEDCTRKRRGTRKKAMRANSMENLLSGDKDPEDVLKEPNNMNATEGDGVAFVDQTEPHQPTIPKID